TANPYRGSPRKSIAPRSPSPPDLPPATLFPSLLKRLFAHHGKPGHPTPFDADNFAGSLTLAVCNDWRTGVRRFHVGTGHSAPTREMRDIRRQVPPYCHNYRTVSCFSGGVHIRGVRPHRAFRANEKTTAKRAMRSRQVRR